MITTARQTEPPSAGMLEDFGTLVGFVPQAGPPVFVAAGALVFGSLLLAGPFALAVTIVVVMALVAASVALLAAAVAAIVMAPYVLVRQARRYRFSHRFSPAGRRPRPTSAMAVAVRREPIA
jgi:hypothetical protein